MIFYVGLHKPKHAQHFERCCISVRTLLKRKQPVLGKVLLDSGAFSELRLHGRYRASVAVYADQIRRLHHWNIVRIEAAVTQDYMCEPFMLARTGGTVEDHQRWTIERYDALVAERLPVKLMPVLQGYAPADYAAHVRAYGARLVPGMWVGVGSVCKRNAKPPEVLAVLQAILSVRPDLKLHGFGLKVTALDDPAIRGLLHSADSMAWSFAARYEGRNGNSWVEARHYVRRIERGLGCAS